MTLACSQKAVGTAPLEGARMAVGFRSRYRQALRSLIRKPIPRDGFPVGLLKAAEVRLGVKLPKALWDFYAVVGRHKLNQHYNRLLSPVDLFLATDHLVFMEENQAVVYWGVSRDELSKKDPPVFQAQTPEEGPWYSEGASCSEFLIAMLYWQAVGGGLPYTGYAERVGAGLVRQIKRTWP